MRRLSGEQIGGLETYEALGSSLIRERACQLPSVRRQIETEEVGGIGKRVQHPYGLEIPFHAHDGGKTVVVPHSPQRSVFAIEHKIAHPQVVADEGALARLQIEDVDVARQAVRIVRCKEADVGRSDRTQSELTSYTAPP